MTCGHDAKERPDSFEDMLEAAGETAGRQLASKPLGATDTKPIAPHCREEGSEQL